MDFSPLLQSGSFGLFSSHTAYQRSHGDLNVIMALLEFIGNDNNSNILSKAAYGLSGGSGISLGLIGVLLNLGEVTWDSIDDAQLTAEQVADLALDMVDNDLLASMETIDLSILGSLRLNKIDYIIEDICTLRDSFAWTIGSGLLGDLGNMDFSPLLQSGSFGLLSSHTAYQRSHGDLNVIMALLEFIGNDNNSNILSKAAYGLSGGSGVSLGLIGSFLDLGEVGDMPNLGEVKRDNIDDAQLTAEQVADLALDMVDNDLLASMETIDLSILGSLRLNKIDYIIEDICTLRDSFAWTIGSGLLGDLGDMDFSPLLQSGSFGLFSSHTAYSRSHGNVEVIMALLEFIGNDNNSNILSKAAYGLSGGNGISLGIIGILLNLGEADNSF